ncbi:MAG: methyltransferase [Halobaculum sp.]
MTESDFPRDLRATVSVGGEEREFTLATGDGLLSSDAVRPAVRAVLRHVDVAPDDDALVLDGNRGLAGVALGAAAPDGEVLVTETSARAAEACRLNADRNGTDNVSVSLTADPATGRDGFDCCVFVPRPYDPVAVVQDRLVRGLSRLRPGGRFFLAGPSDTGVQRYADTLDEYAASTTRVAASDGVRVIRGERGETVADPPGVPETEFRATVGDYTCRFLTQPGLFSWESLDDGTAALLRAVSVADDERVLDCCCGYGAVGAFVGARSDCDLVATDDDVRATALAEQNVERNGVTAESVTTGDCLDAVDGEFDVILTNPPTHAGDGVTRKLFASVRDALTPDGRFCLVANEIMRYDDRLADEFGFETTVLDSTDGFDVIRARK